MGDTLNATLACTVFAVCLLTSFGLKYASRKDALWLPAFAATAMLKALALCVVCMNLVLWIKDNSDVTTVSRTAPPLKFMLLLLLAPETAVCLLLSGIVFLLALLVVKVIPSMNKVSFAPQSRKAAAKVANAAALCLGLAAACFCYNIG